MQIKKNTPLITTTRLDDQKAFYCEHFGFRPTFDSDDYLGLVSEDKSCELSFMRPQPGTPDERATDVPNVIFCLEVEDVDAEHDRLTQRQLQVVQPPTDNPWGDRSAILLDPIGIKLYIYQPIPLTEEYAQYVKE